MVDTHVHIPIPEEYDDARLRYRRDPYLHTAINEAAAEGDESVDELLEYGLGIKVDEDAFEQYGVQVPRHNRVSLQVGGGIWVWWTDESDYVPPEERPLYDISVWIGGRKIEHSSSRGIWAVVAWIRDLLYS